MRLYHKESQTCLPKVEKAQRITKIILRINDLMSEFMNKKIRKETN